MPPLPWSRNLPSSAQEGFLEAVKHQPHLPTWLPCWEGPSSRSAGLCPGLLVVCGHMAEASERCFPCPGQRVEVRAGSFQARDMT